MGVTGRSHIKVRASFQAVSFKLSKDKEDYSESKVTKSSLYLSSLSMVFSFPALLYTHMHTQTYTYAHKTTTHMIPKLFIKLHVCDNMVAYIFI